MKLPDVQSDTRSLEEALEQFEEYLYGAGDVFLIGNGGSAAVCSHISVDYCKFLKLQARALNDPAILTCVANDYGYPRVFAQQLLWYMRKGDFLIAISSSGESRNILEAVSVAKDLECPVVTLSAFKPDNTLRSLGYVNFYVPTHSYRVAEVCHLNFLHSLVDV